MAAYDINENMNCCENCIYHYYDSARKINRCSLHGHAIAGDYLASCGNIIKRYEPLPWTGFRMIESLMDKTFSDDEEIMIYIVLGATQAVKMATIDMDDNTLKRAVEIRDAAKKIYAERKVNK